jgi:hypothetical protein
LASKGISLGFSQIILAEADLTLMFKNTGNEGKCECMVEVRYREVLLFTYEPKLDVAKDLLRKEGLFHPKTDPFGREKDILIWHDDKEAFLDILKFKQGEFPKDHRINACGYKKYDETFGRFRVTFLPLYCQDERGFPEFHDGSGVYFRYWGYWMTPDLERRDPMLPIVQKMYDFIKPQVINICHAGLVIKKLDGVRP